MRPISYKVPQCVYKLFPPTRLPYIFAWFRLSSKKDRSIKRYDITSQDQSKIYIKWKWNYLKNGTTSTAGSSIVFSRRAGLHEITSPVAAFPIHLLIVHSFIWCFVSSHVVVFEGNGGRRNNTKKNAKKKQNGGVGKSPARLRSCPLDGGRSCIEIKIFGCFCINARRYKLKWEKHGAITL